VLVKCAEKSGSARLLRKEPGRTARGFQMFWSLSRFKLIYISAL